MGVEKPKPLTAAEHRLLESLTITGWRRQEREKQTRKNAEEEARPKAA